ncbi:MAG: cyclase family protein [Colwellia sp.]|nr:cyclase family protein [Colwellia sp.]
MISATKITIQILEQCYQLNTDFSFSLAIPVEFTKSTESSDTVVQPNHFDAKLATSKPMQGGSFIGDTQQGGSCNVNELFINPHCNGTHTETIAHICDTDNALSLKISDILISPLMPCVVISVEPTIVDDSSMNATDSYTPKLNHGDKIIQRADLEKALNNYPQAQLQCLVVRTLPNDESKCTQVYNQNSQPAFFTRQAILYLNERGIEHLVVDIPSLDRLHDDGLLTCHHLFWQVNEGSHQASPSSLINKTITEMAFIDNQISDDFYFINLQTPAFNNDAAPSRPVLFNCQLVNH